MSIRRWTAALAGGEIRASLGESPCWDQQLGVLWWVDAMEGVLYKHCPENGQDKRILGLLNLSCVAIAEDDALIIGAGSCLYQLMPEKPLSGTCWHRLPVKSAEVINDCGCDSRGRLWVGTIIFDGKRFDEGGGLFRVPDALPGDPVLHTKMSNGIGWTRDGRTMYLVDTMERRVRRFDYDPTRGVPTRERSELLNKDNFRSGSPDGLCVDSEDGVWVAHNPIDPYGVETAYPVKEESPSGKIVRYLGGKEDGEVVVPGVSAVTSCAFGGPGLRDLFVTTMRIPGIEAEETNAGALFKVTLPISGQPPVPVSWRRPPVSNG